MADDKTLPKGKAQDPKPNAPTAAEQEAARRAGLSQQERDAEDARDAAELAAVDEELAAENAAKGTGTIQAESAASAAVRRRQIVARLKARNEAERAEKATVEVTVARGRSVFLTADQTVPHGPGAKIMVTPEEAANLRAAGHLVSEDGSVIEPVGPKVYQEAGLIVGHAAGQTQGPASAKN